MVDTTDVADGSRFSDVRSLLDSDAVIMAPGAWDGLSARMIKRAGFSAVCSSGYAISASLGFPDIELLTATENATAIRHIHEACHLPLIADIDTGYGNAVNVIRTVSAAELAGASAVFLEDQLSPKRCPISVGEAVDLLPLEEAASKVRAAADAKDQRTVLIARTDAVGDDAVRRLDAYRAAGADLLMPVTKTFSSIEEWMRCSSRIGGDLVATLTAGTWVEREFTADVMRELGVRIALLPTQVIHASAKAVEDTLGLLHAGVPAVQGPADTMSHAYFNEMLGFQDAVEQQALYMPPIGV